jgi:hypothetical protein
VGIDAPAGVLLGLSLGLLAFGAVCDAVENLFLTLSVSGRGCCAPTIVPPVATAKLIAPILAILLALPVAAYLRRVAMPIEKLSFPVALSVLIAVDAILMKLLFLGGDIGLQIEDAIRIAFDHGTTLFFGAVAILLFSATVSVIGDSIHGALENDPRVIPSGFWLLVGVVWVLVGVVCVLVGPAKSAPGAYVFGGITLFIWIISYYSEKDALANSSSATEHAKTEMSEDQKLQARKARYEAEKKEKDEKDAMRHSVTRWTVRLAIAPPVGMGVAVARVGCVTIIGRRFVLGAAQIVTGMVIAIVGAWMADRLAKRGSETSTSIRLLNFRPWLVIVGVALLLWLVGYRVAASIRLARDIGVIALLFVFLSLFALIVGFFSWLSAKYAPPTALKLLGFRRVPVLVIAVVGSLVSSQITKNTPMHNARVKPTSIDDGQQLKPIDGTAANAALDEWSARSSKSGTSPLQPLVIVSASGGGIRAAAWTSLVMDCLLEGGEGNKKICPHTIPWSSWFAGGGASGGSVGLASVLARHQMLPEKNNAGALGDTPDWIRNSLGLDHISPMVATQLFRETPAALLRVPIGTDRTSRLEQSWAEGFKGAGDCGFFTGYSTAPVATGDGTTKPSCAWKGAAPYLSFNSTNAADGCRVNVTPLQLAVPERDRFAVTEAQLAQISESNLPTQAAQSGNTADSTTASGQPWLGLCDQSRQPAETGSTTLRDQPGSWSAHDFSQMLCTDQDVSLATAAFLSARFPFVSSAGHIDSCPPADRSSLSLVDGGYRENTGAAPMADLVDQLTELEVKQVGPGCFQPVLVEIENGYAGTFAKAAPRSAVLETLNPLLAVVGSFQTETKQAPARLRSSMNRLNDALRANGCQTSAVTVAHFRLEDEPGSRAPLGWSLAEVTLDHLGAQLRNDRISGELCRFAQATAARAPWSKTCMSAPMSTRTRSEVKK